jgi:AFG3 family protein
MNKEDKNINPENKKPTGNEPGNKKDQNNTPGKGKPPFNFYWIYAILAVLFIALQFYNWGGSAIEISQQRFENQMLGSGDVEKIIVVNREIVEVFIREDRVDRYEDVRERGLTEGPHYTFKIGSVDNFEQLVRDSQKDVTADQRIPVFYEQRKDWGSDILSWLLPIGLLIVFWIFIMRRMAGGAGGGQIFNIGKSKAQVFDKDTRVNVNFNHVAGLDEAKIELMEIVDFLKNPKKYTDLGGQIPKGALLVGPPGTGKTLAGQSSGRRGTGAVFLTQRI